MTIKNVLNLTQPKPYQEVGASFVVSGWISKSWLKSNSRYRISLSLEFLDIKGQTFMGSSADLVQSPNWLSKITNRIHFSGIAKFHSANVPFIKESQGRIVIKVDELEVHSQPIFIPLIVKELEPKEGASPEIVSRHGKVGEMVRQYEKDLENYYKKLEEIEKSRQLKDNIYEDKESNAYFYIQDWDIASGILGILNRAEDTFEEYLYSKEDREEKELEEKYKDALKWRGPLFGAIIGNMNGFLFRLYSNDHGKHFHVVHKEKGINARFSFPEIKLMDYENSRYTIGSKEQKDISEFFRNPENFKKLENEINRRDQRSNL